MNSLRPESEETYSKLKEAWKEQFNEDLPEVPDETIADILDNYPVMASQEPCPKVYWNEVPTIYKVGNSYIRASIAESFNGSSPKELGWGLS